MSNLRVSPRSANSFRSRFWVQLDTGKPRSFTCTSCLTSLRLTVVVSVLRFTCPVAPHSELGLNLNPLVLILMKKERSPTPEEYEKLLLWFHDDQNIAGESLTKIQTRLIQIFTARQCIDADELAYEVINRVAVRIDSVREKYPTAALCCLAFVEHVYQEWLRDQIKRNKAKEPPKPRASEELEREDRCLTKCLANLEDADRRLFVRYFGGEGRARIEAREVLAKELGLTPNALRIKAHRLRKRMRLCIEECLAK